jgi:hypothetical protein
LGSGTPCFRWFSLALDTFKLELLVS